MWKIKILAALLLAYLSAPSLADPFATLKIFAPKNVTYGMKTHIIIAIEELGSKPFVLNVSSTGYMIAYFTTDPSNLTHKSRWHLTLNLNNELQRFNLTKKKAPYKYAYYYMPEAIFWRVGAHELVARLEGNDGRQVMTAKRIRKVLVAPPASWLCLPQIELTHCTDAWRPMRLDTAVPQYFMARITSDCMYENTLIYKWQLCDVSDQEVIIDLGRTSEPTLGVGRYRFNEVGLETDIHVLYVTALGYKELPVTAARCYVVFEKRPIKAIIAGGAKRAVKAGWKIFLSGTSSRDYAQNPGAQTNLDYQWRCSSNDDPDNMACAEANGKAPNFELKPDALQLGKQYNFTLTLSSGKVATRSSLATQLVSVKSKPYIYLTIQCLANCDMNSFEANEPVSLQAECLNCFKRARNSYDWHVNGKIIEMNRTGASIIVAPETDVLEVEVKMSSQVDNFVYVGRAALQLSLNSGPTGGECRISPTIGYEEITDFVINCRDYHTEFMPIEYQFYADDLWLHSCAEQECVTLNLPQTEYVNISICDIFEVCTKIALPVVVKELAVGTTNDTFIANMNTSDEIMHYYLRRGDWTRYILHIYAKARHARKIPPELFDIFGERISRLDQLEQIITIANKNLKALLPLDDEKMFYFTRLLGKIAVNFSFLINYKLEWHPNKQSYHRISQKLLYFITDFSYRANKMRATECRYESKHKLLNSDSYEIMPDFDLDVMQRIGNWLQANHNLDIAIKMLGISAAAHAQKLKIHYHRICCEMVLKELDRFSQQDLTLDDKVNRVSISPKLIDEVEGSFDTEMSLQVFRLSCNRFWFYPDCQALSTSIITVNLISERSSWDPLEIVENPLNVYLMLNRTQILESISNLTVDSGEKGNENKKNATYGRYTQNETINKNANFINVGSFNNDLKTQCYLITLKPNSLLVVKILYTDMPLRIKLKEHKQPSLKQIQTSSCRTGNGSITKTILNRNRCGFATTQLFIAFGADIERNTYKPNEWPNRNFRFQLEERECNAWQYDLWEPTWTTNVCMPAMQPTLDEFIHCECNVFATYSATISYTKALLINPNPPEEEKYKYPLITVYVLLLVLLVLMRYVKLMRGPSARNLIVECNRRTKIREPGDIIVQIHTGGFVNAGTSSNITLGFYSLQLGERHYVLHQDSFNAQVAQNTTYTLRLSSNDVQLPTLLIVGHDQEGLFPNWFLRSIAIYDLRNDEIQIFPVEKWITHETVLMSSRAFNRAPDALPAYSWRGKFRNYFEEIFINWFFFQPLMGPWRYGSIGSIAKTRYQRSCIWISQFGATLCFCLLCIQLEMPSAHMTFLDIGGIDPIQVCIYNYILVLAIEMLYNRFPMN